MRSASPSKIYNQLRIDNEEIRLLIVRPGNFEDQLVCNLAVASLQSSYLPEFETISYCWGDASERALLRLNGYQVDVPASSAAAIRRMRNKSRSRVLWIDAICINQLDLDEKTVQVENMGKVYSSATGNLVYLGEDSAGNAAAEIAVLQALVEKIREAASLLSDEEREMFELAEYIECWRNTDLISINDVAKLKNLFSAPWFMRLWVVQEVTLASSNTFHWGELAFALNDVILVADVWCISVKLHGSGVRSDDTKPLWAASALRSRSKAHLSKNLVLDRSISWFSMHDLSCKLLVSDPRDHVYALLGLKKQCSDGKQSSPIKPDYRKSVGQVYRDATRCSLESEGDFILGFTEHRNEAEMMAVDRPSWTVMWGRPASSPGELSRTGRVGGLQDNYQVPDCEDLDVLPLRGYLLEAVTWNTGAISLKEEQDLASVRQLAKDVLVAAKACSDEVSIRRLLSSVFICGYDFRRRFGGKFTLEDVLSANDDTFQRLIRDELYKERSMFVTSDNYIGSGPRLTRNGDRLFIAEGGCRVHVVRPAGDHFLYVGVAWVRGLMDGEVLDKGIKPRIIDIR